VASMADRQPFQIDLWANVLGPRFCLLTCTTLLRYSLMKTTQAAGESRWRGRYLPVHIFAVCLV
jgi:hypothetical protein